MVLKVFIERYSSTQIRDILPWPRVTLVAGLTSHEVIYASVRLHTLYSYLMDRLVSLSTRHRLIDVHMARQFWTSSWLLIRSPLALCSVSSGEESYMIFKLSNGTSMASANSKIRSQ